MIKTVRLQQRQNDDRNINILVVLLLSSVIVYKWAVLSETFLSVPKSAAFTGRINHRDDKNK